MRARGRSGRAASSEAVQAVAAGQDVPAQLGSTLLNVGAGLVGLLVVWGFLQPTDATSVFEGEAATQNLVWLAAGVVCAAACCLAPVGTLPRRIATWQPIVATCLMGWLVWITISAGQENNPRTGWNGLWHVLSLAVCYFCIRSLCVGIKTRAMLTLLCLTGCTATALHGLHQVGIGFERDRAAYRADPEAVLREIGIYAPEGSPQRANFEGRLFSPEPFATYALANSLGAVLGGALLLLAGLWWGAAFSGEQGSKVDGRSIAGSTPVSALWRWLPLLIATMAVAAALVLTLSRSAYLAVIFSALAWLTIRFLNRGQRLSGQRLQFALVAILVVTALGLLWLLQYDQLVFSEATKSLRYRLEYWYSTVNLLREHWLMGVGFGNFQSYYPAVMLEGASETIADPHNWFLDIAISLSLPVSLLTLVWLARILLQQLVGLEVSSDLSDSESDSESATDRCLLDRRLARCLLVGAVCGGSVCVMCLSVLVGIDTPAVLLSWLGAALLAYCLRGQVQQLVQSEPSVLTAAVLCLSVALLATGSWQATGIAVPLLCWLVAGRDTARIESSQNVQRPAGSWLSCGLIVAMLVTFVFQSWIPASTAWTLGQRAEGADSYQEQLELARQAVEAEPWDTDYVRKQAELLTVGAAEGQPDQFAARASSSAKAVQQWLDSVPTNYRNWQLAGDLLLELAATARVRGLDDASLLTEARRYYEGAAERYPISVKLHLQLALLDAIAGQVEKSRVRLEEAERLSEQTTHADKKLEMQQLQLPPVLAPPGLAGQGQGPGRNRWPAEPVVAWLRTEYN